MHTSVGLGLAVALALNCYHAHLSWARASRSPSSQLLLACAHICNDPLPGLAVILCLCLQVFYFKNGGLNDLVYLLSSWKCFSHTCHQDAHCHTFTVYNPKLKLSELHPLEGRYNSVLTSEIWSSLKNSDGCILDADYIMKVGP